MDLQPLVQRKNQELSVLWNAEMRYCLEKDKELENFKKVRSEAIRRLIGWIKMHHIVIYLVIGLP